MQPPAAQVQSPVRQCLTSTIETPLGPMMAAAIDEGLCLLEYGVPERLASQMSRLSRVFGATPLAGQHEHLAHAKDELGRYFAGTLTTFSVPTACPGTPFEEGVWRELMRIPFGETISYAQLAARVNSPGGARAVGGANGRNRVSIIIPCHRVINSDGKLGGYGGELWRKEWLLAHEQGTGLFPL
jgi:AraC family transcriptional regulator, regulatory protein of adaptative response / methylated-DNA-[protein]-cysteine methyltransferase